MREGLWDKFLGCKVAVESKRFNVNVGKPR